MKNKTFRCLLLSEGSPLYNKMNLICSERDAIRFLNDEIEESGVVEELCTDIMKEYYKKKKNIKAIGISIKIVEV